MFKNFKVRVTNSRSLYAKLLTLALSALKLIYVLFM